MPSLLDKVRFSPLRILCVWLLFVFFVSAINIPTLDRNASILKDYSLLERFTNVWVLASDANYYLEISRSGYDHTSAAFFPGWPIINKIVGPSLIKVELLALTFTFVFFLILSKLNSILKFRAKDTEALFFILIIFPSSFVFATPLAEPFFLSLSAATIYLAEKNKLPQASLLAALASATKPNGFILAIYLLLKICLGGISSVKKNWYVIPISLSGITSYFLYLFFEKGNFFFFLEEQKKWHSGISIKYVTGSFEFYAKQILGVFTSVKHEPLYWYHTFSFLFFISLAVHSFKKISTPLWIYSFLVTIFPVISGSYTGLPRYLLAGFPMFIPLANTLMKNKTLFYLYVFVSLYFQTYLLIRFLNFQST